MTGVHCLTGEYSAWAKKLSADGALQDTDAGASLQVLPALEPPAENLVGIGAKRDQEKQGPVRDPGPLRGRALQPAVFGLTTTDVVWKTCRARSRSGTLGAERTGRREEEKRTQEAQELGVGDQEQLVFLPTPSFMVSVGEEWDAGTAFSVFVLSFLHSQ